MRRLRGGRSPLLHRGAVPRDKRISFSCHSERKTILAGCSEAAVLRSSKDSSCRPRDSEGQEIPRDTSRTRRFCAIVRRCERHPADLTFPAARPSDVPPDNDRLASGRPYAFAQHWSIRAAHYCCCRATAFMAAMPSLKACPKTPEVGTSLPHVLGIN